MNAVRSHKLAQDHLRIGIPFHCAKYKMDGESMFVLSRIEPDGYKHSLTSQMARAQAVRTRYYMDTGSRRPLPGSPVYVIKRREELPDRSYRETILLAVTADGTVHTDGGLTSWVWNRYIDAGLELANKWVSQMRDPEWQAW